MKRRVRLTNEIQKQKQNGLFLRRSGGDPSVAKARLIIRVRSCVELHRVESVTYEEQHAAYE